MSVVSVQRIERWPLDRLIAFADNARTHSDEQITQIIAAISEFGFVNPILVGADDVIIAGHARALAARRMGLTHVPVIILDHLTPTQRRALAVADNRLPLSAGWDEELLQIQLRALQEDDFNLDLLGFEAEELAALLADEEDIAGLTDEDGVGEPPQRPITQPKDVWLMGSHRLVCGDATASEDVRRLLSGDSADLVFTDPPYNVDYEGYTEDRLRIQGDRMSADEYEQFLKDTFQSYRAVLKPQSSLYVCHPSSSQREFQNALEEAGFHIRCQIIWAKNTFAWGFGRYKFQHEPIFYCHLDGAKDRWYGDKSQSTVWEENKPAASTLHPTMKPVALIERALVNSSRRGDVVLDLFGGSGSTLIACERRKRKARLMELDPVYADVIIRRWEHYAGKKATLEGDGRSHDEIAKERLQKTEEQVTDGVGESNSGRISRR